MEKSVRLTFPAILTNECPISSVIRGLTNRILVVEMLRPGKNGLQRHAVI